MLLFAALVCGRGLHALDCCQRYLRGSVRHSRKLAMLFSTANPRLPPAVPLGLAQVTGLVLQGSSRIFCTVIRGTPLLLQLWLLYYGLGSSSAVPRDPAILSLAVSAEAWPMGVAALTVSFAAYGARSSRRRSPACRPGNWRPPVPTGMGRWTMFRRIWLPRAIHRALPTLNGETVLQLKSRPLVATITVVDVYA